MNRPPYSAVESFKSGTSLNSVNAYPFASPHPSVLPRQDLFHQLLDRYEPVPRGGETILDEVPQQCSPLLRGITSIRRPAAMPVLGQLTLRSFVPRHGLNLPDQAPPPAEKMSWLIFCNC